MPRILFILLLFLFVSVPQNAFGQDASFDKLTANLQKIDGFMPLYWDAKAGKMFLEISRFNKEFLYQVSLPAGLGSNPVGLDRGQMGRSFVVYFERVGPKILLVQPNYRYRALSDDDSERRAVNDSFAKSVIYGFQAAAEKDDRVLVDATAFLMRDAHGVADRLRQAKQGNYRVDESRSAFYLERTKGFPLNTEIETTLTFAGDEPGRLVGSVTPTANSVTLREHHSFSQLPDDEYKPRKFDPRVNSIQLVIYDYASPLTEPLEKRWVTRHRLIKKDPDAAVSEPVKPIVYYVDNGAPEPIRSALVEGASWWNQAFEAAGFKNAFQVKVLPKDADPMDIRYNMINWVNRSTRGWSYGASIEDPRTGEIIRGNVSLGSLRIRQDFMLATGLIPAFAQTDERGFCAFGDAPDLSYLADTKQDAAEMSLARIRQLAAHEVGHTLGFEHNFAASSYGRASVMDYPAPLVEIKNGKLDLSNAYAVGIGAFDKYAVRYVYSEFPKGADEAAELEKIVEKGQADGMLYVSDDDARGMGTAHPLGSTWDNGSDMVASLKHEMEVRRIGLGNFGLRSIPAGTPVSELEKSLIPLYLHHRYQLVSALKSVGGMYFAYAMKTENGVNPVRNREIVAPERQREALGAVLDTIRPEELALPDSILKLLPPRADGYAQGTGEYFEKRTDPVFDAIGAAMIAADLAISGVLEPHRAARMIEFNAEDKKYPHFQETIDALLARIWKAPAPANNMQAAILAAERNLLVERLMDLTANPDASAQVRAVSNEALYRINESLKIELRTKPDAQKRLIQQDVERFLTRPDAPRQRTPALPIPPGEPIG
ncbi:MAG: zinc-dependent metalloprotease [Acidobacteria bacterium]|nr:zinc-dependent metalloprotease [Acidobacteriota bacterium]